MPKYQHKAIAGIRNLLMSYNEDTKGIHYTLGSVILATPPCLRISAGTLSKDITAQACWDTVTTNFQSTCDKYVHCVCVYTHPPKESDLFQHCALQHIICRLLEQYRPQTPAICLDFWQHNVPPPASPSLVLLYCLVWSLGTNLHCYDFWHHLWERGKSWDQKAQSIGVANCSQKHSSKKNVCPCIQNCVQITAYLCYCFKNFHGYPFT